MISHVHLIHFSSRYFVLVFCFLFFFLGILMLLTFLRAYNSTAVPPRLKITREHK